MIVAIGIEKSTWMMTTIGVSVKEARKVVAREKVTIVTVISLNAALHSNHTKISPVTGFSLEALAACSRQQLSSSCSDLYEDLACFFSIVAEG
jgi:hypothetical protein